MKRLTLGALTLAAVAAASPVSAQQPAAQQKQADTMPMVREKLRADKKLLVADNVPMTEAEAKGFWLVYDAYQKDMAGLNDRTIKVINDYAASYQTMTDETADRLLKESVAIDGDRATLAKAYMPKFGAVLSAKKVARYYQIENKIRAVINYDLAANIPLVK